MKVKIEISMDNTAFDDDGNGGRTELARILHRLADYVERATEPTLDRYAYDFNGNKVGQLTEEATPTPASLLPPLPSAEGAGGLKPKQPPQAAGMREINAGLLAACEAALNYLQSREAPAYLGRWAGLPAQLRAAIAAADRRIGV